MGWEYTAWYLFGRKKLSPERDGLKKNGDPTCKQGGNLTSAVMRLLVQRTTTLEWCFNRSRAVSREFTALIASNGSFPFSVCSLLAVRVSTSSTNTHMNVSGSSSSKTSMLSNILATSLLLSLKNLLPKELALISTSLLCGYWLPRRIDSFCARARLVSR